MNNSQQDNKSIGELTSFHEMLTSIDRKKRFDEILIPKIQRDYAQGRPGRELMRRRFLKRLFNAIDSDNAKNIKLDFVYGQAKDGVFLPIDGQQRLTTLFLLYLYLGKRAGEDVSFLKNFTYDTRDSSKEFCLKLIEIPENEFRGIRKYVENQWWFTRRWSLDPTISSMLVMLDDIDIHYKDIDGMALKHIWYLLTEQHNIEFWNLRLDDLDTSDDLYIKMNARGKKLTDFEHFKSEIEGYLYNPNDEEQKKKASAFSLNIDTVWTSLLWAYREKDSDSDPEKYYDNGLDRMFINIFKHFMVIEGTKLGMQYKELEDKHILNLSEEILKDRAYLLLERFTNIMNFFAELPKVKGFFEEILTNECDEYRIRDGIKPTPNNYKVYLQQRLDGTVDFFDRALQSPRLDIAEMLMLEAFLEYADHNEEKLDATKSRYDLKEKIRIIRNLIINSRDELRAERMQALLLRIDMIMNGEPLNSSASGEFRQAQMAQENAKIKYYKDNQKEEWDIKFAENHSVLCGNLAFYMNETGDVLTDLLMKHEQLFNANADYDQIERFLLTFGDYAPVIRGRKLYGGRHWDNWRDDIFTNSNKVSTPVIHRALNSNSSFDAVALKTIIDKYISEQDATSYYTWPYYLVKHKGTRHGDWARYALASDCISYDFIMMNKNNFNGKHWNPFLYCMSIKLNEYVAKLADYNAPLVFEKEDLTIYCNEADFEIIRKDGVHQWLKVPQTSVDGVLIDTVDRIEWACKKIKELLSENC